MLLKYSFLLLCKHGGLRNPLVAAHSPNEILNSFVHVILDLWSHKRDLFECENANPIEPTHTVN